MPETKRLNLYKGETLMARLNVPGDGIRAPGMFILVSREGELHPYVTWWFNAQSGGKCHGNYFKTYTEAAHDFADRIKGHIPQRVTTA